MQKYRVYRFVAVLLAAVLVLIMLPAGAAEAQGTILYGNITNAYRLNVRSGPGVAYGVVTKVSLGDQVALVGRNGDGSWVQLQGEGQQWINAYYVSTTGSVYSLPITSGSIAPPSSLTAIVVGAQYLNTRVGPGPSYPINQRLSNGQQLALVARNGDGSWVQLASGSIEWVNAGYLSIHGDRFILPISNAVQDGDGSGGYSDPYMATIVNVYFLNVRTGPSMGFDIARRVSQGDQVKLIGRNANGSWVQLESASGYDEWINAYYARTNGGIIANLPVTSNTLPSGVYTPPGGTTSPPGSTTARTHVVQAGENLFRISLRYGVSLPTLAAYNGIVDYNRLYAGQVLVIP
ncbi:MAG: SH3 domain-containing protein [Anaerolineae bacterium]|nr:SH3 domain-containing protein [Anaerolineae bacterium]